MNEAVDRVLANREAIDRGLPASIVVSTTAHLLLLGGALGAAWLGPKEPPLKVVTPFIVPLPPGGGGPVAPEPAHAAPAAAPRAPDPQPVAPRAEPPPKVLKPPREEAPVKALPPPEAKKSAKPRPTPTPRPAAGERDGRAPAPGGARAGTGTSNVTPGMSLVGPPGPGVPWGTDPMGDWYLAGVQRKIWTIWTRQVKSGFTRDIAVSLTILADGSLEDGSVRVLQTSGIPMLDLAASRAVYSAQPFGPLPKSYGTNRFTIQALFQPTP